LRLLRTAFAAALAAVPAVFDPDWPIPCFSFDPFSQQQQQRCL
jgi:hypothetical protein